MKRIIGFTQGAFDMFHIGHLNLLRNVKSQCDYLIVGVNSGELVREYKHKDTIIPFEERIAIVNAIRYVDEVVRMDTLDKAVSWSKKHYHLLFIGDDWKGDDRWIETEKEMAQYGVKVVYLPYTRTTSSSIIRQKLLSY